MHGLVWNLLQALPVANRIADTAQAAGIKELCKSLRLTCPLPRIATGAAFVIGWLRTSFRTLPAVDLLAI